MAHAIDLLVARANLNRAIAHLANSAGSPTTPQLDTLLADLRDAKDRLGALIEPPNQVSEVA